MSLALSEDLRSYRLGIYYEVLNDDVPAFRAELEKLYLQVAFQIDARHFRVVEDDARADIDAFVDRWHLPLDRGLDDVTYSLCLASRGQSLRLRASGRGTEGPSPFSLPLPLVTIDPTELRGGDIRELADRIAQEVHQNILDRGEEILRKAGGGLLRPEYTDRSVRHSQQNDNELRMIALRFYRRAVLGWSSSEIIAAEPKSRQLTSDCVEDGIKTWSEYLCVPVDKISAGHPRESRKHLWYNGLN